MHYNMLDYSIPFVNCSNSNNNLGQKDQNFRTLLSYTRPDIIAVCEIGSNNASVQRLLDSAVNAYSSRVYQRTLITNYAGSQIINMIFWDPNKVILKSQEVILNDVRDINLYKFYLNDASLPQTLDTIYFTAILTHLKAGSDQSDQEKRASMTLGLMNYLNAVNQTGNYLLSGDLNLYRSSEQAYQNLLNYSNPAFRFIDPIDSPGDWSGSPDFAGIHTQSTHQSSNGCASGGGMDDRFDFILVSSELMNGNMGMHALPLTYKAVGQDGNHLNLSVNSPPQNYSVPQNVLAALYGVSDHLPLLMDIHVDKALAIPGHAGTLGNIRIVNPVQGALTLEIPDKYNLLHFQLVTSSGQILFKHSIQHPSGILNLPVESIEAGFYILRITDDKGNGTSQKVIVGAQ